MVNGEQSGSRGQLPWQVRLATGLGTVAGTTVALLLRRDLGSFWLGMLAFLAVTAAGGILGRIVGGLLFRPSSGNPPDHPPRA